MPVLRARGVPRRLFLLAAALAATACLTLIRAADSQAYYEDSGCVLTPMYSGGLDCEFGNLHSLVKVEAYVYNNNYYRVCADGKYGPGHVSGWDCAYGNTTKILNRLFDCRGVAHNGDPDYFTLARGVTKF